MTKTAIAMLRGFALRVVLAVLPVAMMAAMVGAHALGGTPSIRSVTVDVRPVAEINVANTTVGVADSSLYFLTPAEIDRQLDELQGLGVQNVRVFVPWSFVQPTAGTYDWSTMDTIMKAAAARNMGVLAEINSTPAWAAPSGTLPGAGQPDLTAFRQFVGAFATKYSDVVSAYEIWNEPNYVAFHQPVSPEAYTQLLQAAYPEIKSIDPTATVVAAGLGAVLSFGGITLDPVEYVKRMYQAGAAPYFDALAFHPYQETLPFSQGESYPLSPLAQLEAIKALMDQYDAAPGATVSDKLVWVTEYGLPTANVTQQQQASFIQDFLQKWSTLSWAGPAFVYTTRDQYPVGSQNSQNPEYTYGIFNNDWTPKLAAEVIRQWIAAHPTQTLPQQPPVDPVAQFLQAVAQQLANAVAQALAQALANWAAALANPAPVTTATASPQVAETAVAARVVAAPALETATVATGGEGATAAPAPAAEHAAEPASRPVAVETTVTSPPVSQPAVEGAGSADASVAVQQDSPSSTPAVTAGATPSEPQGTVGQTPAQTPSTPKAGDATPKASETAPAAADTAGRPKGDSSASDVAKAAPERQRPSASERPGPVGGGKPDQEKGPERGDAADKKGNSD